MIENWQDDFTWEFNELCRKNKQPFRLHRRAKTMEELKRDNLTRPLNLFERLWVCGKIVFNSDLHILKKWEKAPQG